MSVELEEIVALQSQGANGGVVADRQGGAGPSDAKAFVVDGLPVMIPTLSSAAQHSNYSLCPDTEPNAWRLEKDKQLLFRAQTLSSPRFYELKTSDGISYSQIARRHGTDGLASTVIQECFRYKSPKTRCRFCAIGASLASGATIHTKTPEQLAEVAVAAKNLDGITHVTLTSGTTENPDEAALYLGRCAKAVKEASGLPVEIQFEPLRDKTIYSHLKEMGVDDVGIHIESFDERVRRRMTPGKSSLTVDQYFEAFADAVAVFGRNKVSTYVILGLGEDEAITLAGCERAASLGVYPFVVPLRPLADSYLAKAPLPDPNYLVKMYKTVGAMLEKYGLSASGATAGCVRCRACSPLQFVERTRLVSLGAATTQANNTKQSNHGPSHDVQLKVASSPREIDDYYTVRREVFVTEQGVFSSSDFDEHDGDAIHIVALVDGQVAGTVRCYPDRDGVWFGGRLAVRSDYRVGFNLGALLVRKAVETMENRVDVQRFLATVQMQNVRFFQRLGWKRVGEAFELLGRKHQTMEIELRKVHQ